MHRADMFEQPDRGDPVEFSLDIAVIHQLEPDLVGHPRRLGAFLAEGDLVGRQRDAEHLAAIGAVQIEREPPPAAAEIEHAHVRPVLGGDGELGGDMRLLVELRLFQADIGRPVIAHGVLSVLVEEQLVEPAGKIVGVLGIPARLAAQIDPVGPGDRALERLAQRAPCAQR